MYIFILFLIINSVCCQINLGTLNINRNPNGDFQFGVGQSANIFGFGGDREFGFVTGPGKFDTKLGGGALIGGERLGLDGGVGVQEGQGLNLGSKLNFGNQPPNPNDPAGQLNTFINNVGYFFQRFMPPPGTSPGTFGIPPSSTISPMRPQIGVDNNEMRSKVDKEDENISNERLPIPKGLTLLKNHDYDSDDENLNDEDKKKLADLQ